MMREILCAVELVSFRGLMIVRLRHAEVSLLIYDHHRIVDGSILSYSWKGLTASMVKVIEARRADRFRTVFKLSLTITFAVSLS